MHPAQYMELIHRWEEAYPVERWRIDGVRIWPLLRFQLAGRLRQQVRGAAEGVQPGGEAGGGGAAGKLNRMLEAGFAQQDAASRDLPGNANPYVPAQVLFLHHSSYRAPLGGPWHDRILGPLRTAAGCLGLTCLGLEYSPPGKFRYPRAEPTHYIQAQLARASLAAHLPSFKRPQVLLDGYSAFLQELRAQPALRGRFSAAQLARQARQLTAFSNVIGHYLRASGARLAVQAYYYNPVGMALCLAARRLGIPCVDVQHGVQGAAHFAYGPWLRLPPRGYRLLPTRFWCWDEPSARNIDGWSRDWAEYHGAVVGGNPWMAWLAGGNAPGTAEALAQVRARKQSAPQQSHVLISLQWDRGLTEQLKRAITQAPANWLLWVRLHPVQLDVREGVRAVLEHLAPGRYELDLATDAPLPLLLAEMDAHLTRSSTVVVEAAQYGVPSVALAQAARGHYPELLGSGALHYAPTADEALKLLGGLLAHPPKLHAVQADWQRAVDTLARQWRWAAGQPPASL